MSSWWRRMDARYPRTWASACGTTAGVAVTATFGWLGGVMYLAGVLALTAVCAWEVRRDG